MRKFSATFWVDVLCCGCWTLNFIFGLINVFSGRPFASDVTAGCAIFLTAFCFAALAIEEATRQ